MTSACVVTKGSPKYFDLLGLVVVHLYWRKVEESKTDFKAVRDVLAQHRQNQNLACLRAFSQMVLQQQSVEKTIADVVSASGRSCLAYRFKVDGRGQA